MAFQLAPAPAPSSSNVTPIHFAPTPATNPATTIPLPTFSFSNVPFQFAPAPTTTTPAFTLGTGFTSAPPFHFASSALPSPPPLQFYLGPPAPPPDQVALVADLKQTFAVDPVTAKPLIDVRFNRLGPSTVKHVQLYHQIREVIGGPDDWNMLSSAVKQNYVDNLVYAKARWLAEPIRALVVLHPLTARTERNSVIYHLCEPLTPDERRLVRSVLVYTIDDWSTEEAEKAKQALLYITTQYTDPATAEYSTSSGVGANVIPRFARTRRPITYMRMVASPPVTPWRMRAIRYMDNLDKGIWISRAGHSCGTFFYYDPDAVTFLATPNESRVLFAANKVHAFYLLAILLSSKGSVEWQAPDGLAWRAMGIVLDVADMIGRSQPKTNKAHECVAAIIQGLLHITRLPFFSHLNRAKALAAMKMPATVVDTFDHGAFPLAMQILSTFEQQADIYSGVTHAYMATERNATTATYIGATVYAMFDQFDGMLCEMAGVSRVVDIIVLQSEPGRMRAVTELFDVRARSDAFSSLVRDDRSRPDTSADTSNPAMWYPRSM